ncbi:cyclin dependent kinase inhibitor [Grosmannia clavigera kw1407]|uniref:Cyclin dependent kinase inhibitor n=1 Tax=Grosmannia clavigera (strain kw1407 / UAMH 11150) TaxID=655863 RepID=F0XTK8_GROCL|nr:cyclin dependent kinase inhibitor [Grosmannia clavigera kw1407]EFW98798.1 cyclin dependent kinase inhibitor [Grosmannia clavigera kw1407]
MLCSSAESRPVTLCRAKKFGKQIQKRQLEVPEYAASFVNYKALKKLIKRLSATPTLSAQTIPHRSATPIDSQAALQANRATFFFQLERELEKVNAFYLQKEAELKVRLKTLLDKKKVLRSRGAGVSRRSAKFTTLQEGFQQFANDLNKLQQFVEINGTAFSKILKKWDKTSKLKTKELYLSRAVEVQPFFNATVISELSDQATTSLQELGAWAEGDHEIRFDGRAPQPDHIVSSQHLLGTDEGDADTLLLDTVLAGHLDSLRDLLGRMTTAAAAARGQNDGTGNSLDIALAERVTRTFLASINEGSQEALKSLIETRLVDVHSEDDINETASIKPPYTATPGPDAIDLIDHDNFTPLIHAIIHGYLDCVSRLLEKSARLDPISDTDHVPLNLACEHGSDAIVELLLKYGARILPDAEGLYPQHLVARSGRAPTLLLLLQQYGANLNQVDKLYGWTPLVHAASEGNVPCLQALLEAGVDPNIVDEKDLPAMYYAAWEGNLECMQLLTAINSRRSRPPVFQESPFGFQPSPGVLGSLGSGSSAPIPMALDPDAIPVLELPPPIIPLRRYGHNFLDTKTVVQISFDDQNGEPPLVFFHDGKYPAARLTISSKVADLIPKNIMLPFQEDTRLVSFQVDNLDSFVLDFEVFPTYGAKIIAKTVALSSTFRALLNSSGNSCCLPLFDPRLRAIGQISFHTQVVKPFPGKPLEIADFETYWKATSQLDGHPSTFIAGSSLSGDYVRVYVQNTRDGVPVLWPTWTVNCGGGGGCASTPGTCGGIDIPVARLTYDEFLTATAAGPGRSQLASLPKYSACDAAIVHQVLAASGVTLRDALALLPSGMHVNLELLYPSADEERVMGLGGSGSVDLNAFVDSVLAVVFDHARAQRAHTPDVVRSMVFSSYNPSLCTAINWKQPNFPVFLCNDLGREDDATVATIVPEAILSSGRRTASVKEVVRTAQSNNFMGLVCSSRLLDMVPALVDAIKSQGLILVVDKSAEQPRGFGPLPKGIDGVLKSDGVLRFNESIDMEMDTAEEGELTGGW